jgi:hypothetical protein
MIRTVLKLAFVALIANATWHMFGAVSPHYKFKDGVEYAVQYAGDSPDEELRDRILALASQFDVPVTAADVSVSRNRERHTIVDISYMRLVELAPGFTYPLPLSIHVDTISGKPIAPRDLVPK